MTSGKCKFCQMRDSCTGDYIVLRLNPLARFLELNHAGCTWKIRGAKHCFYCEKPAQEETLALSFSCQQATAPSAAVSHLASMTLANVLTVIALNAN